MAISFDLVPANAAASAVFVEQEPVSRGGGSPIIPHKILVIGQYDSSKSPTVNEPRLALDLDAVWTRYGRGSMLALLGEAVFRDRGTVPVYFMPVADAGTAVAATGTLAITGPASADGTLYVYVAGQKISVSVTSGDTATEIGDAVVTAVTADQDLPVSASNTTGTVTFTVNWGGESGNQIKLETNAGDDDEYPAGVAVTVTDIGDVVAGENNPAIDTGLGNLGDDWYTEIVCPYLDSTSLTSLDSAGDDRVDPGVKRPFAGFVGYTDTSSNYVSTFLDGLNSQWITSVPVHGSSTPAMEIAAAIAGTFAKEMQANPAQTLRSSTIQGVKSATGNALTYTTRQTVVLAGGSHTYNKSDGTVTVGDLVTTRTETDAGAATTDWRFTIIIANLQFKIYSIENTYSAAPFDDAVVVTDTGPSGPSNAVSPGVVKAYAVQLVDDWVGRGLSTSRDTIVENIVSEIDSSNSGRINLLIPDVPSAGLRILAAKVEWAFVTG